MGRNLAKCYKKIHCQVIKNMFAILEGCDGTLGACLWT